MPNIVPAPGDSMNTTDKIRALTKLQVAGIDNNKSMHNMQVLRVALYEEKRMKRSWKMKGIQ